MKNDHQVYLKKRKKWMPSVGMVLTVCALLLALAGCAPAPNFEGCSVKNADRYELDITAMNGMDTHALELKEGDRLKICFETVKGALTMKISAPDGTTLYQGDGTVTEFTVEAPVDGIYPIVVVGQKAKGIIRVDVERVSAPMAEEIIGPWHLAEGENDDAAANEPFPGAMVFGNSMKITSDGKISWYIGADSGTGTYTLDENHLLASVTNDFDGTNVTVELTVEKDGDQLLLTMDYKDLMLCWAWGDDEETWKTALREDLAEKYGVIPEYYEDLGGGIYQVYVEVGGEIVPFVTVDSATGDYHG